MADEMYGPDHDGGFRLGCLSGPVGAGHLICKPHTRFEVSETCVALLRRVSRGDRSALGELYDATVAGIYGMVWRMLSDPRQAEQLTEAVYLHIWREARDYRAEQSCPAVWLIDTAHRYAVAQLRSGRVENAGEKQDGPTGATAVRFLADLPFAQQETIQMAYYGGATRHEIARRLGVDAATVAGRLRDGLMALQESATEDDVDQQLR